MGQRTALICVLTAATVITSCTPPTSARGDVSSSQSRVGPAASKRLVASVFSDPAGFYQQLTKRVVGSVSGLTELQQLVNAGTYPDDRDVLQPSLAEAVRASTTATGCCFRKARWKRPGTCGQMCSGMMARRTPLMISPSRFASIATERSTSRI